MGIKTLITLFLGLAFQLAQILPGGVVTAPCGASASTPCECCAGSKSCCCATGEAPAPKPSPLPLTSGDSLKVMAMRTAETRVAVDPCCAGGQPATPVAVPTSAPHAGFAGVRLAVAFCSFVI
jgi:hypothetical protein